MHELMSCRTDDHSIRIGLALDASRDIRRFAECELFVSTWAANFADHDWAGVNADADLEDSFFDPLTLSSFACA